jgi:hypothetical protein
MEDNLESLEALVRNEKFLYFSRGEFPCLFLVQVQEGFMRLEIKDETAFELLMTYCREKSMQIEWVQAILNDEFHTKEYEDFPGGKYIAHQVSCDILEQAGI